MRKEREMEPKRRFNRHDFFMMAIVLPCALFGSMVTCICARDIESHQQADTTQVKLETLEDSIHYYEDGF
jgi:hypothetical protein